jgi:hypothetical protein
VRGGYKRMNMLEILCIHVCKWKKMRPVKTISEMGERKE